MKNKFESGKNTKDRSKKYCRCGCHNCSNAKSNLNHSGTKRKLSYKKTRRGVIKWKLKIAEEIIYQTYKE